MYDLCIIGGGVAGISAAITAAQKGMKVAIIEKDKKLGRKLYATGNGRCNLTNQYIDYEKCYNSSDKDYVDFLYSVMGDHAYEAVNDFCKSIGILTEDIKGYVYPKSFQASSVVWAMSDKLAELGVIIHFKTFIKEICRDNSLFILKAENEEFTCSQVILTCGGKSYESLGGTDSGYILAKNLGHNITTVRPALCGLTTKDAITKLSGVRTKAKISVYKDYECDYELLVSEIGELQISDYGLSGIMIFNVSSQVGRLLEDNDDFTVTMDFLPGIDMSKIKEMYDVCGDRTVVGFLNTFMNDKLASFFASKILKDTKIKLKNIDYYDLEDLIHEIKNYDIEINGIKGYDQAQVCAGGVSINQVSYHTLMSVKEEGVYFAGEILDIDGICGGYNITFAILSGKKAGESAYDKNNSN